MLQVATVDVLKRAITAALLLQGVRTCFSNMEELPVVVLIQEEGTKLWNLAITAGNYNQFLFAAFCVAREAQRHGGDDWRSTETLKDQGSGQENRSWTQTGDTRKRACRCA